MLIGWIKRGSKNGLHFLHEYLLEELLLIVVISFLFIQPLSLEIISGIVIGYATIIVLLNSSYVHRGIRKALVDIKRENLYGILLLIILILLFIWQVNVESIFFIFIFFSFLLYGWDSRITAFGALVSLASCPVLLIFQNQSLAEDMAVYAYYFLVITVVLQIIEYRNQYEKE